MEGLNKDAAKGAKLLSKEEFETVLTEDSKKWENQTKLPEEIEEPNKKTGEQKENSLENLNIEHFAGAGRKLVNVLKFREEERYRALIDDTEISKLSLGLDSLEEGMSLKNTDIVEHALTSIAGALENLGQAHNNGSNKEDAENLEYVSSFLKDLHFSCVDIKSKPLEPSIVSKLNRIIEVSENKWQGVRKIIELIQNY